MAPRMLQEQLLELGAHQVEADLAAARLQTLQTVLLGQPDISLRELAFSVVDEWKRDWDLAVVRDSAMQVLGRVCSQL